MTPHPISLERSAAALTVKPAGERLDASVAEAFVAACSAELENTRQLRIDLADIRLLDSAGIGAFARLYRLLGDGGRLTLCNARPEIRTVLEITRLDRVFTIEAAGAEEA